MYIFKNLLFTIIVFASFSCFAQDRIELATGEPKDVKITAVDSVFIHFYFLDDESKTSRNVPLSSVVSYSIDPVGFEIKGAKEVFSETAEVYCQIVGRQKLFSTKLAIQIDYGQERSFFKAPELLRDPKTGKNMEFNSMMDALNFMSLEQGWTYVNAYVITLNNQNVYHYVLKKVVKKT
jgi:hypothetical protein